jgi:hypothetical protein
MSSRSSGVNPGVAPLSARDIGTKSTRQSDADNQRDRAERAGFNAPRRWRRKSGRTEFVAIRTFPEIKDLIIRIADKQEKHLGEVVEDAVRLLYSSLKD